MLDVKLPEGASAALAGSPLAGDGRLGHLLLGGGVKNLLAQILPKLPKEPVDKGATWDAELTLPSGPLKLAFKIKYTLAEVSPLARSTPRSTTTMTPSPEAKITVKITKQSGHGPVHLRPAPRAVSTRRRSTSRPR